jgi:hypothetical protein
MTIVEFFIVYFLSFIMWLVWDVKNEREKLDIKRQSDIMGFNKHK